MDALGRSSEPPEPPEPPAIPTATTNATTTAKPTTRQPLFSAGSKVTFEGLPLCGDVRVDDDGDFRCWHCGFTEFVTPPNVADKTLMQALFEKAPSAAEANRGKCKRCGHRNEMSNPRPWEGPVSKKNWD